MCAVRELGEREKGRAVKERCENSTRFPLDKFSPVALDLNMIC